MESYDALEDARAEDTSFSPVGILDHKISNTIVRTINGTTAPSIKLQSQRQLRVKTLWHSGEVSWVNAKALKQQDAWALVKYAQQRKLTNHPDFAWTKDQSAVQEHLVSQQVPHAQRSLERWQHQSVLEHH